MAHRRCRRGGYEHLHIQSLQHAAAARDSHGHAAKHLRRWADEIVAGDAYIYDRFNLSTLRLTPINNIDIICPRAKSYVSVVVY